MLSIDQTVRLIAAEALMRRRSVVAVFVAVNILAVIVAFSWPKTYTSATTIFVEERNIIEPLMQGAAVPTGVVDRARIAREVIYGRGVMYQLIDELGWYGTDLSEAEKDRIADGIKAKTAINNVGRGLIRIEYSDDTPQRAYQATKRIAELFIAESHEAKLRESQAAYEFISKQADEYHEKLVAAEDQLKEFRSTSVEAGTTAGESGLLNRIGTIRGRLDQAMEQLREAEIRKASLERQLSGETETASVLTREGQYRTRISELQAQLETLRLSYHDTHPDVVRIRHQIADLQESISAEQERRRTAARDGSAPEAAVAEGVIHNPLYQQLRRELSQTKVAIDTLTAKIAETRRQLQSEIDRGRQVHGGEARLAELTRDYEVNRATYQDLSRRRETARVSMNLDRERQGLRFRLQDEASVPRYPSGVRATFVVAGGIVASILLPVGLLFGLVRIDPRVRMPQSAAQRLNIPVLATVPHFWSPLEMQRLTTETKWGLALGVAVLLVSGVALMTVG